MVVICVVKLYLERFRTHKWVSLIGIALHGIFLLQKEKVSLRNEVVIFPSVSEIEEDKNVWERQ
jgi:hypothetical protein